MSKQPERRRLRTTFEEVPELYERARPAYPTVVYDDVVSLGGLRDGARILEIGCGTGQATLPLADRGFEIVCIELGERMADIARQKLAAFPRVEVVTATFESWEPAEAQPFEAVVAFTAFHWIDPDIRYEKAARLLRPQGTLAVVATKHVLPEGGDRFWVDVQQDYDAVAPIGDSRPPPRPDDVPDLGDEIARSGRFRNVGVRRYTWDVPYTAHEYISVLNTYSGHRALDDPTRERLFERIRARIEARPDRKVTKTYLATLNVARRL